MGGEISPCGRDDKERAQMTKREAQVTKRGSKRQRGGRDDKEGNPAGEDSVLVLLTSRRGVAICPKSITWIFFTHPLDCRTKK
jgi:hypothetical protein